MQENRSRPNDLMAIVISLVKNRNGQAFDK